MSTDIVAAYRLSRPQYETYAERLHDLLVQLMHANGLRVQAIEYRAKTVESLESKARRPGKSYADLGNVPDLAGIRIICYYTEDVERVSQLIKEQFVVDEDESGDKIADLAPDQFGYRSIHFVATLNQERQILLEWKQYAALRCELQVRTVLQHAWAAISHALQYKHENEVPSSFRRRLSRLAGILELADEEFSGVRKDQLSARKEITKTLTRDQKSPLEINKDSFEAFIRTSDAVGVLADAATKAGFTLGTVRRDHTTDVIDLTEQLDIRTTGAIEEELRRVEKDASAFFVKLYGQKRIDWTVDRTFVVLLALLFMRRGSLDRSYFRSHAWHASVGDQVLRALGISTAKSRRKKTDERTG